MKIYTYISILLSISFSVSSQTNLKATYSYKKKQVGYDEVAGMLNFGFTTGKSYLYLKGEKVIFYNKPDKYQKILIVIKGQDFPFDTNDTLVNLNFIDTINKYCIFRKARFGTIYAENLETRVKVKVRNDNTKTNLKYKLFRDTIFKYVIYNEQKKINGLNCNRGEIRNKNELTYKIWVALKVPCYTTIFCMRNCPGLIVEAESVRDYSTYTLISYETNKVIDDNVFDLNELKEKIVEVNK